MGRCVAQPLEDVSGADDRGLFGMGERYLDDLDAEECGVPVLIGARADAAGQLTRRAHDGRT